MKPSDLLKDSVNMTDSQFERKLNTLVRNNARYKNLDKDNRKLIVGLFKKHKSNFRKGIGLTYSQRAREMMDIKRNKGVSKADLKDIKEIMDSFKSR